MVVHDHPWLIPLGAESESDKVLEKVQIDNGGEKTKDTYVLADRVEEEIRKSGINQSDEAHFWLNGYVNRQNCRIWSEANPQVYVETPLHPEKLTVWCALCAGGILLQKR
ncbi:hypothetical protein TNCV_1600171 [Trichonephila clavipes]|nr:hypothetical protein TNCV_1600171 [Trichonephila clavipes]